jgi:hypothetical protein
VIIIYLATALVGGLATALLLGSYSLLAAVLLASVGSSLLTVAVGLYLSRGFSSSSKSSAVPPGVVWC